MFHDSKLFNPMFAVMISSLISLLSFCGFYFIKPVERFFLLLGGDFTNGGMIQFATYIFFFWALFEIRDRNKRIDKEKSFLKMNLLSEKEQYVYYKEDIKEIKLKFISYSKSNPSYLTELIKNASTKYVRTKNVSEVMTYVEQRTNNNLAAAQSSQEIINYLVWAIPSIGFIGTIWGIAASLGLVAADMGPEQMKKMTDTLSVAFDTTLIALLLSIIIMYLFHMHQEEEEKLHLDISNYVTENFVNRLGE